MDVPLHPENFHYVMLLTGVLDEVQIRTWLQTTLTALLAKFGKQFNSPYSINVVSRTGGTTLEYRKGETYLWFADSGIVYAFHGRNLDGSPRYVDGVKAKGTLKSLIEYSAIPLTEEQQRYNLTQGDKSTTFTPEVTDIELADVDEGQYCPYALATINRELPASATLEVLKPLLAIYASSPKIVTLRERHTQKVIHTTLPYLYEYTNSKGKRSIIALFDKKTLDASLALLMVRQIRLPQAKEPIIFVNAYRTMVSWSN